MIPSGMEVRYFGLTCRDCGCHYAVPMLSDHSYGEFILHGRGVSGYLAAVSCPAWDDIESRLQALGLLDKKPSSAAVDRLQDVVAAAADRIGGQRLFRRYVCPHCQSPATDGGTATGKFHRLPAVTFTAYEGLAPSERDQQLRVLWDEAASLPPRR